MKPWYKSKGKVAGVLLGLGGVLTALGNWLQGNPDPAAFQTAFLQFFTGLGVFGVRDRQDKKE